jgi:hypothetical protein
MCHNECEILSWNEKSSQSKARTKYHSLTNCLFIVTKILLLPVGKFFTNTDLQILVSK